MWFGGFQPFTLSDYPACIAAIAFSQGCNFRCRYCHNSSLLPEARSKEHLLSSGDILDRLADRLGKVQGLVVSGGEPTVQDDLPQFIEGVKRLGFKIKLDTNGSNPDMLAVLLDNSLLDYVAMDIKAPFPKYAQVCGVPVSHAPIQRSISLIAESGISHHFRTTFAPPLLTQEDLDHIRSLLPDASEHIQQAFQPRHALDPLLRQAAYA